MNYAGAEEAMLDAWVKATLEAGVDWNAISTGLGTRIYDRLAPKGALYPYIVFQAQTPPDVVRGVGAAEVMVDSMYVVKAVAQGNSYGSLAEVASEVHKLMTKPNGEEFTDGFVWTSIRERGFSMTESEATSQYRSLGAVYRIQAQAKIN